MNTDVAVGLLRRVLNDDEYHIDTGTVDFDEIAAAATKAWSPCSTEKRPIPLAWGVGAIAAVLLFLVGKCPPLHATFRQDQA
jgi:hypothetical protein